MPASPDRNRRAATADLTLQKRGARARKRASGCDGSPGARPRSFAPENRADRRSVCAGNLQRQCDQLINTSGNATEIERFNYGDAGGAERVMIRQVFRRDLID